MGLLDRLNDGAADSFHHLSKTEYDIVQESFREAAETIGKPGFLFNCYPYMKAR